MITLLCSLDARSPEKDLPFDPFRMKRVYVLQDAADPAGLVAVAEYGDGLGVLYAPGNMSLHGGAAGRDYARQFGRWLHAHGVQRITVGCVSSATFNALRATQRFDPTSVRACDGSDMTALHECFVPASSPPLEVKYEWVETGDGNVCHASAVSPISQRSIRFSCSIARDTAHDFVVYVGGPLAVRLRPTVERNLRGYIEAAVQFEREEREGAERR